MGEGGHAERGAGRERAQPLGGQRQFDQNGVGAVAEEGAPRRRRLRRSHRRAVERGVETHPRRHQPRPTREGQERREQVGLRRDHHLCAEAGTGP